LRYEHRKAGAADAARTVLRARVGRRTACVNAVVGDDAGEQFRPLHDKKRKPQREQEPPHERTIPRPPQAIADDAC